LDGLFRLNLKPNVSKSPIVNTAPSNIITLNNCVASFPNNYSAFTNYFSANCQSPLLLFIESIVLRC
jgi:hypothetical protein